MGQLSWSLKLLVLLIALSTQANIKDKSKTKRILFVMTSNNILGSSGMETGNYLPEFAHPYNILINDYEIDFASPKGGNTPIDPLSVEMYKDDPECNAFLANEEAMAAIRSTRPLDQVQSKDYDAIFFPGGNGPLYDLSNNAKSASLVNEIYENGGIVASVCHGTCGLVNVKLPNNKYFIEGKNITGFSNAEEEVMGLEEYLPFLLEDQIKTNGGNYQSVGVWEPLVVVDGRIVTGQNPASSYQLGEVLKEMLSL